MNSNRAYFGEYISPEDVFEPTKDSISQVIKQVELDRDDWEAYLEDTRLYKQFKKDFVKNRIDDYDLINYYQAARTDRTDQTGAVETTTTPRGTTIPYRSTF